MSAADVPAPHPSPTAGARFTLASSSPRRLELLVRLGIVPDAVVSPDIDESVAKGELPMVHACRLARTKLEAVDAAGVVLAADTVVAAGRRILGKAEIGADVAAMLALLSGRRHHCLTAIAVRDADGRVRERLSDTVVAFRPLTPVEIAAYAEGDEGLGKAGGYAIQGRAEAFVRFIHGSHSGVVGLPLAETRALLRASGLPLA